jgi:hypothetical protein
MFIRFFCIFVIVNGVSVVRDRRKLAQDTPTAAVAVLSDARTETSFVETKVPGTWRLVPASPESNDAAHAQGLHAGLHEVATSLLETSHVDDASLAHARSSLAPVHARFSVVGGVAFFCIGVWAIWSLMAYAQMAYIAEPQKVNTRVKRVPPSEAKARKDPSPDAKPLLGAIQEHSEESDSPVEDDASTRLPTPTLPMQQGAPPGPSTNVVQLSPRASVTTEVLHTARSAGSSPSLDGDEGSSKALRPAPGTLFADVSPDALFCDEDIAEVAAWKSDAVDKFLARDSESESSDGSASAQRRADLQGKTGRAGTRQPCQRQR